MEALQIPILIDITLSVFVVFRVGLDAVDGLGGLQNVNLVHGDVSPNSIQCYFDPDLSEFRGLLLDYDDADCCDRKNKAYTCNNDATQGKFGLSFTNRTILTLVLPR